MLWDRRERARAYRFAAGIVYWVNTYMDCEAMRPNWTLAM